VTPLGTPCSEPGLVRSNGGMSFGSEDQLKVFEVWESQAAFEEFGKSLMPILQQLGIDPGVPALCQFTM
jgi:hypothetical protein